VACSIFAVSICHPSVLPPCVAGSIPITVTGPTDPGPLALGGNLQTLKEQLKQQLAAIEAQEKANEESMKPQSVAEVDDLQQKLQSAMEELKSRRAELVQQEKDNAGAEKAKGKEPGK
jgi:hypothetical protein